jgi:hypothetical protein
VARARTRARLVAEGGGAHADRGVRGFNGAFTVIYEVVKYEVNGAMNLDRSLHAEATSTRRPQHSVGALELDSGRLHDGVAIAWQDEAVGDQVVE